MSETAKQETASGQQVPHERVVSCDDVFYDSKGNELREFDVVKVFHFIGKRRKRHYMYKWIRKDDSGRLCMKHLADDASQLVSLSAVCKKTPAAWIWVDAEIVQSCYS